MAISRLRHGRAIFFEVLVGDFRLELLFQIHLLEAAVLVFELLHARHHEGIHATELGTSLVKSGAADAQFPANLGYWQTDLNPFERSHDLAVGKSILLHLEIPF